MTGEGALLTMWKGVFLIGIAFQFFILQGNSLYFSQSEVSISRTFLPESGFLFVAKAIRAREDEDGHIQYFISKPELLKRIGGAKGGGNEKKDTKTGKCLELEINKDIGNISISFPSSKDKKDGINPNNSSQLEGGTYCRYRVFAIVLGNGLSQKNNSVNMTLNLHMPSGVSILSPMDDCKSVSRKELCFGGINQLEMRVMENAPVTPIAYLGSIPGMCETFKIRYNVTIREGVVTAGKVPSKELLSDVLKAKANLDREAIDRYNMSLNCILESSEESNKIEVIQMGARLVVLDENDNVPEPESVNEGQNQNIAFISLSDHNYRMEAEKRIWNDQEHSNLLIRDSDTVDVNNFDFYSVNDTKKLLNFSLKLFSPAIDGLIKSTSILIHTRFSNQVASFGPWVGYYCVLTVLNDTTLIPPKRGSTLNYTICVNWGEKSGPPRSTERPPTKDELAEMLDTKDQDGRVPRSAQKFYPVMYPFPNIVRDVSESISDLEFTLTDIYGSYGEEAQDLNVDDLGEQFGNSFQFNNSVEGGFSVTGSMYMNLFKVTPNMGIVYVMDPMLLTNTPFRKLHLQIFCNSSVIEPFTTNVTITLEEFASNDTLCEEELCAEHAESKSCELACGFGSMGRCRWRDENGFSTSLSNNSLDQDPNPPRYSTCTPRIDSCPDKKCDELEEMFPQLCPQDCATEIHGFGRLIQHADGRKYGIDGRFCEGVGSCQDLQTCSCAHLPPQSVVGSPESPPIAKGKNLAFSTTDSECGQKCMVMYLAISLISTGFVMLSLYIWKTRNDRKRKSRSLNQSDTMTENGIEMPYRDTTGHGTLISDAEYMPRGMNHNAMMISDDQFAQNQVFQVESKWEISREDLLLEHVLGEGQFGRVLKGRLNGHGGALSAVAVKILKVDATEGSKSLWQEFMAEFSLLKQVDHPNVIKLLGACTTAGGPPYLVMEYAEYGALRSFLRKCRRVEKISSSQTTLHWDNLDLSSSPTSTPLDVDYVVTPREVLGFSWQIAKGMAYLSDMKMVHRDLAARNILLTKLKVCKISDFGLTRDIYVDDAYQKKSKDRVPVKWLAPECLADELYTTKSDVWAFGILVWELTTLGASPYPGIQTEQLYALLNTGYRMPQPHNCSNELYSLMRRCWAYQPTNRPTFHQIVLELSRMLEDGIEYLKLDFPSVSNPGYDYFSQTDRTGSEVVNLSPAADFPISEVRQMSRRKLSMENLRLIDYEISTDDEFLSKRHSDSHACTTTTRHTYINDPTPSEQDCSNSRMKPVGVPSSSGYESPIRHPASVAV